MRPCAGILRRYSPPANQSEIYAGLLLSRCCAPQRLDRGRGTGETEAASAQEAADEDGWPSG